MPSSYLVSGDYAAYGLPAGTTTMSVWQASTIIDSVLGRPEGLVYTANSATGLPVAMAAMIPSMTFTLGALSPGASVTTTVSPPIATTDMIGEVMVLDRAAANIIEACIVTDVPSAGTMTLARVVYAHSAGVTADRDMAIAEEVQLSQTKMTVQLSRRPVQIVLAAQGLTVFAMPPLIQTAAGWLVADMTKIAVDVVTGELYVPPAVFGNVYFKIVRAWYIAGYTAANIPAPIKMATANLILANTALGAIGAALPAGVQSMRAGDTEVKMFGGLASHGAVVSASAVNTDMRLSLKPYRVRMFM